MMVRAEVQRCRGAEGFSFGLAITSGLLSSLLSAPRSGRLRRYYGHPRFVYPMSEVWWGS